MPSDCISFQSSGYFTPLINDYLNQKDTLKPLYNRFPSVENFKSQMDEKQANYNPEFRKTLVNALDRQYKDINTSAYTQQNIKLLAGNDTYTITTGHQLN